MNLSKLYHTKSPLGKELSHFREKRTVKTMSKGGYI